MTGRAPATPSSPAHPRTDLDRRLGTIDAAAVVVSNVIGSGILMVPAFVAGYAPAPWAILTVWLAGGLLAFAGAMAYAELATMRPRAGGEYVYLRAAYGPLPAFLTGWTSFVAGFSGAIAAAAVGLAAFLGRFVPLPGYESPWVSFGLGPLTLALSPQTFVAILVIMTFTGVHAVGLGPGRVVQNTLAAIKVLGLVAFAIAGLTWGHPPPPPPAAAALPPVTIDGWLLALVPVMFGYSGWNAAAYVAEEIRDPAKRLPRALALGTATVVVVFLAMNVVYLYAIPIAEMASLRVRVVDVAAERLFAGAAANIMTVLSILITAGTISAMTFAGPRVYYAMARDGLFVPLAAHVHPVLRTPLWSIIAQGVWSSLLVLSGTFNQLVSYTGFAVVLFAGVAVAALFVLRWREPDAPRPFKAWGYPVAPALFIVLSAAMVVNAIWREPGPALAGLIVMGCGIPLYFWLRLRQPGPADR
jgi:basic amino acid/polyamine antiporter, APA family